MIPVTEITEEQAAFWSAFAPKLTIFTAPEDPPGCVPCPGLVTEVREMGRPFNVVRVPWKLTDVEIAQLAAGGTLWLSTYGGLPAHYLEVQAVDARPKTRDPWVEVFNDAVDLGLTPWREPVLGDECNFAVLDGHANLETAFVWGQQAARALYDEEHVLERSDVVHAHISEGEFQGQPWFIIHRQPGDASEPVTAILIDGGISEDPPSAEELNPAPPAEPTDG